MEFSANTYLDVYNGHVNTLNSFADKREKNFHAMMSDIFAPARCVCLPYTQSGTDIWHCSATSDTTSEGVAVADLDLDVLEE